MAALQRAVAAGADPDFGRTHLPAPIAAPPFYAMRNHAITLVTFQGLDIDASLRRPRRVPARPIPGLYAVGEVIGAGATCGNSFCSGMLLTPALTSRPAAGAAAGSAPRLPAVPGQNAVEPGLITPSAAASSTSVQIA